MTASAPTFIYNRVYDAIKVFHAEHGRCPRQVELAAIMKVTPARAAQMYQRAVKLGQVTRPPERAVYTLNPDWTPISQTEDFWSLLRAELYTHSGGTAHLGALSMACNILKWMRERENSPDLFGSPESMDDLAKAVLADPVLFLRQPNMGRKSYNLLVSWAEARLGISNSKPAPPVRLKPMEDGMFDAYNA